ncbi:MAG: amidohydrolase [Cephaloticoccus sp.]|nr:amidohydrolase [Cephaloticoccus sp.]MCF7759380.1 amidohydrolase [Cephaloticoccus sp.]
MSSDFPSSSKIKAIDAHGHYGRLPHANELLEKFSSASAEEVAQRAHACGVEWSIVSPLAGLMPRGRDTQVAPANDAAFREVPAVRGLLQYVIVNPLQPETYAQAREMLKSPWCVGIKIHPEENAYRIADHGDELFSFFEEVGAPVMTHSGCPNSLPDAFVPFADRYPKARVLLAHLGNGAGADGRLDLQVRAVQAAKHGNLWVDTSSARSILPGLVEWAVQELGAERLLFGSDTPLYHVALQRARIEAAEITDAQKQLILRDNAVKFFDLSRLPNSGKFN